jgi:hypothetical protein
VTGVQTCALPIYLAVKQNLKRLLGSLMTGEQTGTIPADEAGLRKALAEELPKLGKAFLTELFEIPPLSDLSYTPQDEESIADGIASAMHVAGYRLSLMRGRAPNAAK